MALIQASFSSVCLSRNVPFCAIVPVDKRDAQGKPVMEGKALKTLYLLHGFSGSQLDWVTGTRIQAWAREKNLAVIMPSGENKFYVDNPASGDMFGEFIGKELVEFTRGLFPLSGKREDTFIAGLSMGGYGALRNGLKYADTFGYVAGLSSALIIDRILASTDDDPNLLGRRSFYESIFGNVDKIIGSDMDVNTLLKCMKDENKDIPKIYLACGTEDFLIEQNRELKSFLDENEIDVTYEEGPGGHTWEFWDTYIKKVLDWLPL